VRETVGFASSPEGVMGVAPVSIESVVGNDSRHVSYPLAPTYKTLGDVVSFVRDWYWTTCRLEAEHDRRLDYGDAKRTFSNDLCKTKLGRNVSSRG
jgi:hypothetical protein